MHLKHLKVNIPLGTSQFKAGVTFSAAFQCVLSQHACEKHNNSARMQARMRAISISTKEQLFCHGLKIARC